MRTRRIKEDGAAYYHVITRVIEKRMLLDDGEKERFYLLLRKVEGFCAVRVLTYAVLDNHLHILLHVPQREDISDGEFLRRMGLLYERPMVQQLRGYLRDLRVNSEDAAAEKLKARWTYRMYDLSQFMKTLMQRYTMSFNSRHHRKGPLWEDRFKSVLVEGNSFALASIAGYIDVNAVRAGIVGDPKDYRFCGYGEAMGGSMRAREGLGLVMSSLGHSARWTAVRRRYRELLFELGGARGLDESGRPTKQGFSTAQVEEVRQTGGALSAKEFLRCRVRYFSDGLVLGSERFVEDALSRHSHHLQRKRRPSAKRAVALGELFVGKALRSPAIIVPASA